ncbi:FUSC family protein [Tistrella mobilis]|uniref:FUSC family protein n=1 Tax=Tistrella mobilis TaxID=171437 RepID=UPI0035564E6A
MMSLAVHGWPARLGLDGAGLFQAVRLAAAALIAFSIAALLHVQNAYWAAMPVWVVAQSARGLLIERGIFRILGTLMGAGFGLAAVTFAGDPLLTLVVLGFWMAAGAGATRLIRGTASYAPLMAGMTAAVVVLPSLFAPDQSIALAMARVECTLIGVVVVTLVTGLFTPPARRADFLDGLDRLVGGVRDFAGLCRARAPEAEVAAAEHRLLAQMTRLDALTAPVTAGSVDGYRRRRQVDALLFACLDMMAAAETRRLGLDDGARPDAAEIRLEVARRRLAGEGAPPEATRLTSDRPTLGADRDWRGAWRMGAVAGGASFLAGAAGLATGWPAAELAALGVCIFSMVLGSMPLPQKVAPLMFLGVVSGVGLATGYRLLVQPYLDGTAMLILTMAPIFLIGGLGRASTRTALPALDANMCFLLASQAGMPAAGASEILAGSAALILGAALVAGTCIALPRRPEGQAARVAALLRDDLRRLITGPATEAAAARHAARSTRGILRLMLHLGRAGGTAALPGRPLAVLVLARAVAMLAAHPEGRPGLAALAGFAQDPAGTARELEALSAAAADPDLGRSLLLAAAALKAGGRILGPVGKGVA